MNRQFQRSLKRYVGEPDMTLPCDLADLAARLDRKLAGESRDEEPAPRTAPPYH